MQYLTLFTFACFSFVIAEAKLSAVLPGQVALYWGQATDTPTLEETCADDGVDIIILSFLNVYPDPMEINLWPAECYPETSDGSWSYTCDGTDDTTDIVSGIKYCQNSGKKVMLSIGGSTSSSELTSDAEGVTFADNLWKYFGPDNNSSITRPFGDAVIDGFDFDIEGGSSTGLVATANELRNKFSEDSSKTYYLSAAPQCPENDTYVGPLLDGADIDFAFIQFYNNYCSLSGSSFNWDWWAEWAETTSKNKDIKLFLGLPGSSSAAPSGGYVEPSVVSTALTDDILPESSNFGGIMLWNAYYATNNVVDGETYLDAMEDLLNTTSTVSSSLSLSTSSVLSSSSSSSSFTKADISSSSSLSQSTSALTTSLTFSESTAKALPSSTMVYSSTSSSSESAIISATVVSSSLETPISSSSSTLAPSFTLSNTTGSSNLYLTSSTPSSLSDPSTTSQNPQSSFSVLETADSRNNSDASSFTSIDYWKTVTTSSTPSSTSPEGSLRLLPTTSSNVTSQSNTLDLGAQATYTVEASTYIFPTATAETSTYIFPKAIAQNDSSNDTPSTQTIPQSTEVSSQSFDISISVDSSVPTSSIHSLTTNSVGTPNQYLENYKSSSLDPTENNTSTISVPCSTEVSPTPVYTQSQHAIPTTQAISQNSTQSLNSNTHPTFSISTLLYSSVSSQNSTTPLVYDYEGSASIIHNTSFSLVLAVFSGIIVISL